MAGVAACGLLGVCAVWFWSRGSNHDRLFNRWITETPLSLAVDLSQPGQVSAPFVQTCAIAHSQQIRLVLADPDTVLPASTFDGLDAALLITGPAGQEIERLEILPLYIEGVEDPYGFEGMLLGQGVLGPNGAYTATLHIAKGAPALAGLEQRLIARNELCGLERLPASLYRFLSVVSGLIGLSLAVPLATGFAIDRHADRPERPGRGHTHE